MKKAKRSKARKNMFILSAIFFGEVTAGGAAISVVKGNNLSLCK